MQEGKAAAVSARPSTPHKCPGPEILFTKYLSELGRPAHLGSDAGIFLRQNGLVPEDMGVGHWLQARDFLFKRRDPNYVELARQAPEESFDQFVDKVSGQTFRNVRYASCGQAFFGLEQACEFLDAQK